MQLEKLDAHRNRRILASLGAPVDLLSKDERLVDRLAELTEGEPLLVRYYAADLWDQSLKGARIGAADLDTLEPGFGSYFSRWLQHQDKLWEQEPSGIDVEKADRLLSILACALGRLSETDLLDLPGEIYGETAIAANRLLRPLPPLCDGRWQATVRLRT